MEIIRDLATLGPHPFPVVALGNFDGVHVGHQAILKAAIARARAAGGTAFALTFDPLPAKVLKPELAPQLILTAEDKLDLLRNSGLDGVIVLNFSHELSLLEPDEFVRDYLRGRIGVRAVVVGHNVSFGHARAGSAKVMSDLGRALGFSTEVVGPVEAGGIEVSSTRVREAITTGDMKTAALLLSRPHFIRGPVVHGRERGRTIGFPTANIQSRTECLPPDGVYATRLVLDDGAYPSISNIGMRPTFAEPERTIEAHIFDFNRDIYDREVKLEIIERIRPERKFESAQALGAQIASDLKRAKEILAA
ncbi:MAG TPA: bifunctional riboflavin kinase/FAD synthetase [Candidatus Binataceae bacterium]|nr:bifunctional riboflavin kinase/FAD synthetase [Candidatus Binataceae bacterium]